MVPVRSCTTVSLTSLGMVRCSRGSSALMRWTVSMTLAPGWRCTSMMTAGVSWYQPPTLVFSRLSTTSATSLSSTGRIVAVGDDDRLVGLGAGDLVVGADGVGLVRAVERALGAGDVGGRDGVAQVRHAEAVGGEPGEVGLDAHGRLDAALDRDVTDAGHVAQPLGHQRVGEIGELAQRDGGRGQRQRHDRLVGRVHLGIGRGIGQVARQRRARGVDGRLHVLGGGIDVAVEHELQRDLADAVGGGRGHAGERRDLPELALERRGDQVGGGLGIGARQLGRHLDGREIDLRQRGDRQPPVAEHAAQRHGKAQQRGGDRTPDEGTRDAHCVVLPSAWRRSASAACLPPGRPSGRRRRPCRRPTASLHSAAGRRGSPCARRPGRASGCRRRRRCGSSRALPTWWQRRAPACPAPRRRAASPRAGRCGRRP